LLLASFAPTRRYHDACRSRAAVDSDASRRVPIAGVGKLVRRRTGQGAPRRVQVAVDPGDRAISVGAVDVGEADHRLAIADRHVATLANRDHRRLPPGCRSTALPSHLLPRLGPDHSRVIGHAVSCPLERAMAAS